MLFHIHKMIKLISLIITSVGEDVGDENSFIFLKLR